MRGIEQALGKYASQVFTAQQASALQAAGQKDVLPTGLAGLDRLLGGGVARGSLAEIVGPASSGRTGLFFQLMAQASSRGELVACIDAFDSLDPLCAQSCGVCLERMLWVRCAADSPEQSVARALKAADIVAQAGGFGVVALDLEAVEIGSSAVGRALSAVPSRCWFRLQRAVQGTPSVALVLQPHSRAAGAASLVLCCERKRSDWGGPQHPSLLGGMSVQIELVRGRCRGNVRLQSRF